ncbi:MAG: tRNA (guanosine(46)-N7)-methyltransferase TrmB, partial [Gordonia sp. (in: high G+C Gram-positive bacteria)]
LLERPTTKFEGRAEREGRLVNEFVYLKPRSTVAAAQPPASDTSAEDSQ